jgi:hypothetical protein
LFSVVEDLGLPRSFLAPGLIFTSTKIGPSSSFIYGIIASNSALVETETAFLYPHPIAI